MINPIARSIKNILSHAQRIFQGIPNELRIYHGIKKGQKTKQKISHGMTRNYTEKTRKRQKQRHGMKNKQKH